MAKLSLAVKYRPTCFDDLTEQVAVQKILTNQINTGTYQHAYLFSGPAGTGKTTSARIFAKMLNDGVGITIEIDAASNSGVDNIRAVIEDSRKMPLDSKYKIYIIDECHSLSSGAWQALLKLLEEPSMYSIFILCTTDPQKIPGTILSRVQRYQFNKISAQGIVDRLCTICDKENIDVFEQSAIEYIAKTANGGMRDAITLMDKCLSYNNHLTISNVLTALGVQDYNTLFDFVTKLLKKDNTALEIIDNVYKSGQDLKQFIKSVLKFSLDIYKYAVFKNISYTSLPDTADILNNLSNIKDVEKIVDIINLLIKIDTAIKWESDPYTMTEILIVSFIGGENK